MSLLLPVREPMLIINENKSTRCFGTGKVFFVRAAPDYIVPQEDQLVLQLQGGESLSTQPVGGA